MKIEVITDEAVQNQVDAVSKYAEAVNEYLEFIFEKWDRYQILQSSDIRNMSGLGAKLTEATDKLGNTSMILVAENSYIEAVKEK